MACSTHLSRAALALSGVLLLGSGSSWSQANGPARRPGGQPMIEALNRLTPAQRVDYLQEQRSLEENRSRQRLAQLDEAKRCLGQASGAPAVQACWQALAQSNRQQRSQQMQQQQALAQRFGLPVPREGGRQQRGG